jgi:alpha-L-rhamnosidase
MYIMEIKIYSLLLSVLIFFAACTDNKITVYDLRCEHLAAPLGIDVEKPRFSWKLADPAHTRGQCQTAYRILVASSSVLLESGKADIWDSKKTVSRQSHLVIYGGDKLRSDKEYYWKVMVYDRDGRASAWSETTRFSTGLFNRTDWRGCWIKHPFAHKKQHTEFRKNFRLDENISAAFVYLASLGNHILYVNGKRADDSALTPALARIDKRALYVTYDVKPLLQKGDNTVAVLYAPGWSHHNGFDNATNQTFLLQLYGTTSGGESFELYSDGSWKCAESEGQNIGDFRMGDMGGEGIDGRRYSADWNTVDFDDSNWINSVETLALKSGDEPALSAQMIDRTRIVETIAAKSTVHAGKGKWKTDMGKVFTGFLEAKFNGLHAGDSVFISISDRADTMDVFHQNHYYIARGEDGETFRNRFNFFSGRYVHFSLPEHVSECPSVAGYSITGAPERTATFESSDTLFNKIFETDLYTYEMCTSEGFTSDCPNRERLGYGAEGAYQTAWGAGLPCFASGAFYLKNVRDWSDIQRNSGKMTNIAPQPFYTWGGPVYGGANMNIAWEHYLVHGDRKILEDVYFSGKKWIDFLASHAPDGLLVSYESDPGCFLGDWLGPGYRMELGNIVNAQFFNICVHAFTLDCFIRIAEILGHGEDVIPCKESLRIMREKAHEKYFTPAINSYLDGDQVRTAFALYAGIVPDSLREAVSEHLLKDMTGEHPYFDIGSPSRYPYFKTLLSDRRFHETVTDILSKTTYPGYGNFIANGETTLPESWENNLPGHFEGNRSAHVHTSYVGISAWLIKGLAGIEPDSKAPGYRTVIIRPIVAQKTDYVAASLTSPYGTVKSAWRKDGDKTIYDITIPVNSDAEIYIPTTAARITENGLALSQAKGIISITEKDGYSCLHVESGQYLFTAF